MKEFVTHNNIEGKPFGIEALPELCTSLHISTQGKSGKILVEGEHWASAKATALDPYVLQMPESREFQWEVCKTVLSVLKLSNEEMALTGFDINIQPQEMVTMKCEFELTKVQYDMMKSEWSKLFSQAELVVKSADSD